MQRKLNIICKVLLWICSVIIYSSCQCVSAPDDLNHGFLCSDTPTYEEGSSIAYEDTPLYEEGIVLEYCCEDKYDLTGNSSVTCVNGTWINYDPQCEGNSKAMAVNIVIVLSTVGAAVFVCNLVLVTVLTCVYVRRKKRNKKIDWYLRVLKESETNSIDEDDDDIIVSKPHSHYNLVSNNNYFEYNNNTVYTRSTDFTQVETNT